MYGKPIDQVIQELQVDVSAGLTEEQVLQKRMEHGENKLREKKRKSLAARFLEQFKDVMILILIFAACISFGIAIYEGHAKEFFEPILILTIVVVNAIIGVMQESRAEAALTALRNMSAPHAKVVRGGTEQLLGASELVPGDVIRLEAGDFVPADARLIRATALKSEEAALTGESVPSDKNANADVEDGAPLGDRYNMVYSGCSITYGTALAVVTATGMNTEMGKIAHLLEESQEGQTPLQQKLANLGKYLGIGALLACAVIFVVGLLNGIPIMEMFMTAVALAVSAIPEGLPAIVTIVLSIGVQTMARKKAIIRKLPAVETLGSTSVICSDKTGTLTQNRMTLTKTWTDGISEEELLKYSALCCDATADVGDPTETCIVVAAQKKGMMKDELTAQYPRIGELPFDSDRKLMSTINTISGKNIVIVKGAFDILAARCVAGNLEEAKRVTEELSSNAMRVLGVAIKEIGELPSELTSEELETGLTCIGLLGMIDPPRPEAAAAVELCKRAGIRPIMITGDHIITACAIAKELGILRDGDGSMTGTELDKLSDEELIAQVEEISVYARVSPENKIRIVRAWQKRDQIVAMTGDGVNDAPALKAADIGCAMGITGTDVAKGAAAMTLTDDNFATIVDAVREGRGIYENIKKVVGFLLGTNVGEVLTVFFAMILWHQTPLLSMQLLWINLVTDGMPAVALGMEKVEEGVMERPPRPKSEGIFANGALWQIIFRGVVLATLTLTGFVLGWQYTGLLSGGQTMAFMILGLAEMVYVYNIRSYKSLFKINPFENKKLNMAVALSVILMVAVLFTPLSVVFGLIYLPKMLYIVGIALAFVPLGVMEIAKAVRRA